jgi:lipopolysaccharide transport system ATP-binding protein
MRDVASGGRTVVFVSHNRSAVASLCTRAIWLDHGRLRADGAVDDVLAEYHESLQSQGETTLAGRADRHGDGRIRIVDIAFRNEGGEMVSTASAGSDLDVVLTYEVADGRTVDNVSMVLIIDTASGHRIATISNEFSGHPLRGLPANGGRLVCRIGRLPLTGGTYVWSLKARVGGGLADQVMDATTLNVDGSGFYETRRAPDIPAGPLLLDYRWEFQEEPGTEAEARKTSGATRVP